MNYIIGTFLFNYFELGVFLYGLIHFGFWQAVCIAVFFKIGKLTSEVLKCDNARIIASILLASSALFTVYGENLVIICIACVFIEISLIWSRKIFKKIEKAGKNSKVFSRMFGFILAPLFTTWMFLPVVLWWLYISKKQSGAGLTYRRAMPVLNQEDLPCYLVLFFHHMHYFMYCYVIPYLLIVEIGTPYLWTGVLFFLGWGAYNMYEGRLKPKPGYIAWGHLISVVGIIIIWTFQTNLYAVMLGWFLTGLGGGTFYMIKFSLPKKNDGELVELYAQLLGTILFFAVISFSFFDFIFILAMLFAVAVITLSLKIKYRR